MFYKFLGILLLSATVSYALNNTNSGVYQSTYSATNQNDRAICGGGDRGYLHRVCVVDGVAASTAAVYNSSFTVSDAVTATTQNLSGVIDGSVQGCFDFNLPASRGLYIDQFGTAGLNVIFDCYR